MSLKDAIINCLSSSNEVSFGRTMSAIAFLACLSWDTFAVGFAAHKLGYPGMSIHDILPTSDQLQGQVLFCAACYGINKLTEIISAFTKK